MANGLLSRAQNEDIPATTDDVPPTTEADESNLTPEEQEAYNSALQMVAELIYTNDESSDAVVNMLNTEDPAMGVAEAATFIMGEIENTFQGNYPETLVLVTTDEIADLLLDLGENAGVFEATEEFAQMAKKNVADSIVEMYGVDEAGLEEQLQNVTPDDMAGIQAMYGGQNGGTA